MQNRRLLDPNVFNESGCNPHSSDGKHDKSSLLLLPPTQTMSLSKPSLGLSLETPLVESMLSSGSDTLSVAQIGH